MSERSKDLIAILLLLVFGALVWWFLYLVFAESSSKPFDKPIIVEIPHGATSRAVARILAENGVLLRPNLFVLVAKITGFESKLRAGYFRFKYRPSVWRCLRMLTRGGSFDVKITVPEGFTIYEIAGLAQRELGVDSVSFLQACRDTAILRKYGIDAPSMEGFLFPETYLVPKGISSESLVAIFHHEFRRRWRPEWGARAESLGLTLEQVVTLASIIEAEAHVKDEQGVISSVYHNRLKLGMPLQADPTAAYGLAKINEPVTPEDLRSKTPYNTYIYRGLPPGPICNPGEDAIKAALYPESTDYLYFVSRMDGTHIFSKTLKEHNKAINRVRRLIKVNKAKSKI